MKMWGKEAEKKFSPNQAKYPSCRNKPRKIGSHAIQEIS